MLKFTKKLKNQSNKSAKSVLISQGQNGKDHDVDPNLNLRYTTGNHYIACLRKESANCHQSEIKSDAELSLHVNEAIGSSGQPLGPETRPFLDQSFGHDFSKVRIHSDSQAAHSAAALNARAYTLGSNIVFGAGQYVPRTRLGRSLIAHELAHVVQQEGTPAAVHGKLRISSQSDSNEQEADKASRAVMAGETISDRSLALELRDSLRASSLAHPTIQRAVKTWGGEYDTDKYKLLTTPGFDGVDMVLRFKPNKYVDAELIGMTQMIRYSQKSGPFAIGSGKEKKALESRMIPTGDAGAGFGIDRLASKRTPLYGTDAPTKGGSLAGGTPTSTTKHGFRFTDQAGKLQRQDALLKDTPKLFSTRKESSQTFETTALAVKGVQEGTFYGSVQWGWEKDVAGTVKKLPLSLVSNDVTSSVFARASELWNKAKTSKGRATIDLPIVFGKYTNTQGAWLVSNPLKYKTTLIGKIAKNTRLEVTDKGAKQPFNKAADNWWKVTVVEGIHIGKVGWLMQTVLSDKKTK